MDRLRDRAYSTKAGDPLCEEAAAEVERLLWRLKISENIIGRLVAENGRLRNGRGAGCETVACDETSATTDTDRRSIT